MGLILCVQNLVRPACLGWLRLSGKYLNVFTKTTTPPQIPLRKTWQAIRLLGGLAIGLTLSSCGTVYVNSRVGAQTGDLDVRVLPITAETVLQANRQPYAPQTLPAVFFQTAGSGQLRGPGSLPEAPVYAAMPPTRPELRPPPNSEPGPYRLGDGDVLRLALAQGASNAGMSTSSAMQTTYQDLVVRDDGAISIPQVGAVTVRGMTVEEAESRIFERLIDARIDPTFGVQVTGFASQRYTVGGAVAEAQVRALTLTRTSLAEALTLAGGTTVRDLAYATIRLYRDGTLYQIPLEAFRSRADLQNLAVLAGDAIFVDTAYDLDRAQSFYENQLSVIGLRRGDRAAALNELSMEIGLRRAALTEARDMFLVREELGATLRDYVYLTGEVSEQGRVALPYGQQTSLADVLFGSGGFDQATGNPGHIYVLRSATESAEFGAVTAWHLDARNAAAFTTAPRFEMRPDDIVFVQQQPITSWNRAIQQSIPALVTSVGSALN